MTTSATPTTKRLSESLRRFEPKEGYAHDAFVIPVAPMPQPRLRHTRGGHGYYPKTFNAWCKAVAPHLVDRPTLPEGPLAMAVEFVLPPFKTVTRLFPKGDVDNYSKALLDAITRSEVTWKDDVQVVHLSASKRFTRLHEDPHIAVYIREVTPL